jgi:hypothetical protein
MLKITRLLWVVGALLLLAIPLAAQEDVESVLVRDLPTEPAVEWMQTLYRRIEAEGESAPAAARIYGYAGVTMYESLLGGMPDNITLAGQIWHMPDMPLPEEDTVYDWLSVMNGAMSTVLPELFKAPTDETLDAFNDLREAQIEARELEVADDVVQTSVAFGEEIGNELLAWIAEDGLDEARDMAAEYALPTGDGMYVLTGDFKAPAEPFWGSLRPFVLDGGWDCNVPMNIDYSTDPESAFYKQAMEVVDTERTLTDWQQETARYWVDTPGQTGTPAGHWISIANQLVDQLDLTLERTSMMYAMLGMAVADSFISCWSLKYEVLLPRPVTYIQENIRRRWQPYIETPPFPEYPSGHSVVSAAASEVLTSLLGTVAFDDETHIIYDHEPLRRSYTSFEAAATEAAISRLYGGIHYRAAIENGLRQGRCVGARINSVIRLQPISQGGE